MNLDLNFWRRIIMKNILIINAHEYHEMAKGQLNQTLTKRMVDKLSPFYQVKTTNVDSGYEIKKNRTSLYGLIWLSFKHLFIGITTRLHLKVHGHGI